MSKFLATAYALTIIALVAMVSLGRGVIPQLHGMATLWVASLFGLLLLPAAGLFVAGGRRSVGLVRKLLAYALAVGSGLGGLSSAIALTLIIVGAAKAS